MLGAQRDIDALYNIEEALHLFMVTLRCSLNC